MKTERNPAYKLDVAGSIRVSLGLKIDGVLADSNLSTAANSYFNNNGGTLWTINGTAYNPGANSWSIYASSRICGGEFWLKSDIRIKKNIEPITNSMDIIRKLEPKKYNYIDFVKGTNPRYGFIAQEIEKVLPGTVNTDTTGEFIPNIFTLGEITKKSNHYNITLPLDNTFNVNTNDIIKVITKTNKTIELTVVSIEQDNSFNVIGINDGDITDKDIFIYGTKIYDFKTVDYNDTVCIAISAIKEIDNTLKTLLTRIEILENKQNICAII